MLIDWIKIPIAASMIDKGDTVYYKTVGNEYLEAVISKETYLEFNESPRYNIMFISDSKKYKTGNQIQVLRSQLSIDESLARDLEDNFMLYL